MGYRCWNLWTGTVRLQPPLFPGSGSLWVDRCQLPLGTWASRCAKHRSHGERPLPRDMWLVPLALRILPALTTCQSSCQIRETWMREMSLPQWLWRKFQVTQGLLGTSQTCLTFGKMAGAGTCWICILRTQRLLFLDQAAKLGLRMWKQLVIQERHTNGRACSYYKAWGNAVGENLAPIKDFPPWTSKNQQGGWREEDKGGPWNVGSSSKALPMHFSLLRIKSRDSNDNDSHFLLPFYYSRLAPCFFSPKGIWIKIKSANLISW